MSGTENDKTFSGKEDFTCPVKLWNSSSLKLILFLSWFVIVVLVTEIVPSAMDSRDRIYSEGDALPYEKSD